MRLLKMGSGTARNENSRPAESEQPPLVLAAFAAQAALTPEAVALAWEGGSLSYGELAARVHGSAVHLRSVGVRPGALVGVLLERSPDLVVALLAVLEAGAAYLPLEPVFPPERLSWMLANSVADALLARSALARGLPSHPRLLALPDGDVPHPAAGGALTGGAGREDLAYVVYTSGSTGQPKGVLVPHSALAHHTAAVRARYGLVPDDRVLQFASFSFDVAAEELFGTLASGATLVLRPAALPDSAAAFNVFLERLGVTVVNLPASFWHAWVDELERTGSRPPAGLRLVVAGSERVLAARLRAWRRLAGPQTRWLNAYGPTEATITATVHEPPPSAVEDENGAGGVVPIGTPLPHVRALVLDAALRPLPPGAAGELCLGGAALAWGYLGRPDLTAERFVPDPAASRPGARLYRTGDRACFRDDGELEFLGRLDGQLKVRGFRIEPGEVEAALLRHHAVHEAVVVACEAVPGDTRLVAYTAGAGTAPRPRELRAFLRQRLPEALVPSCFVRLPRLPRLPSGKLDRQALPPPPAGADDEHVAPANPAEELLAGLFAELLGCEQVGALDDFFALGGHSLLATRLVARVRGAFGVELPLPRLFAAPTVRELAAALERDAHAGGAPALPPIGRRARPGPFPLSFPQERVWFLGQLAPESIAYNTQLTVHLDGPLDLPALAATLGEIVRRHEIFRTSFELLDGRPVQWVRPPAPVPLPVVDLRHLPPDPRAAEAAELGRRDVQWRFDVARPPLIRWTLLRLAVDGHRLLQVEHHFVHDGWSLSVLFHEMQQLYRAVAARRPSPLPELAVQFADFAAWQREWMRGEVLEAQLAWWRERLAGMPPALELPADRPRPKVQSFRGEGRTLTLPGPLFAALCDVGRRHAATPFMTCLAAFAVLLFRLTGQADLVVGSSVANRRLREAEALIGMIVNNLVLRTDLAGEPTFAELLARVREVTLGAYAHQDVPFEKLVEVLQPERDLGRNPLFQVTFGFHDAAMPDLDLGAVRGRIEYTYNASAKFDLNLVLVPPRGEGEDVQLLWEHSTDLFDGATILRLHRQLQILLEAAAARPEARIDALPLLGDAERHQLVCEWNDSRLDVGAETVHSLIAAQAERTPAALAVELDGEALTYRELDLRSTRLAHHVRRLGIGPETPVGICVDRSLEMVVALLGVLKAGGTYLPLDPQYPRERLAFMLGDAFAGRPPVVLTQARLAGSIGGEGARLVLLDADWPAIAAGAPAGPLPAVAPEQLAYLIYTSGSTGRPKGVQIPHRALVNFLAAMTRIPELAGQTMLSVTTLSFDIAGLEIYLPLATGGRVVLADRATTADGARLAAALARSGATVMQATPATWRLLLEAGWEGSPRLTALCGGEALPRELAQALRPRVRALWNLYGPTETTIWSAAAAVTGDGGSVPIGGPIGNTVLRILDPALAAAPIGVPGELCIGGAGVGRGYQGRPDLTAERFVPDPQSEEPGERLYRTGDLARWLPAGEVEFLGRRDHQVKLRGFRIELGEIEAVLAEHPGVRTGAVLLREDVAGDARLVAYVAAGEEIAADELSELCRRRLPEYMVPSAFVRLAELPRTPNGKLDRGALPAPRAAAAPVADSVAPSGPLEEAVAGMFARAVGLERVGAQDRFFALGGHSLTAARLLLELGQAFGVRLSLPAFFEQPTVAGVARALAAGIEDGLAAAAPPISRRTGAGPAPLSFAQQRLWFLERLAPGSATYHMSRSARLRGPLDAAALVWSLREIVRRHEVLRTTVQLVEDEPVQVVAPEPRCELRIVGLDAVPPAARERAVRRLAGAEVARPFDLERGALLRVLLLRLGPADHALVLVVHHVVFDGASMGVLLRELAALYSARRAGAAVSPLPAPPLQYGDWAQWQRAQLRGERLARLADWWRTRLAGELPTLELPSDRPRRAAPSLRGASHDLALDSVATAGLRALAAAQGVTPFMALLAGFQALLHRYSGEEDVLVGTPIANRTHGELRDLVGLFVNTVVMRTDLSGDPTGRELLARVRETALGAYTHQDMPFERLVAELTPERDLAHTALFQVLFVFDNASAAFELAGIEATSLDVAPHTAPFELILSFFDLPAGIAGWFDYQRDLFEATTIGRLASHLATLLAGLVEDPGRRLSELPLLGAAERRQVLVEWNGPRQPRAETFVHVLFERWAANTPGAPAVTCEGKTLSYGELDRLADRVAHRLRAHGVGRETLVGICMERSVEVVAAILGVLKAGGAYVPLDPGLPAERLAGMLEETGAPLVLTQERLQGLIPAATAKAVPLDAADGWLAGGTAERPAPVLDGDNLAYAIYTSGSTGRPKAVMVSHRALANLTLAFRETFELRPGQRLLLLPSLSFDASAGTLFATLAGGACVVLHPDPGALASGELERFCAREAVTMVDIPAAAWSQWVEALSGDGFGPGELLPRLERIVSGGESVTVERLRAWQGLTGRRTVFFGAYGPTEATVCATLERAAGGHETFDAAQRSVLPLGRPLANVEIYLLDPRLQPLPAGVPGEVAIGGAGVARGYLARPGPTAERFVPSPFGPPGARLYRTGDLARWRADGRLEFLGRLDHQVKIRGFRVEPGEIEAALARHPAVREAVVLAREDHPAPRRLVAYLTRKGEREPETAELRAFLQETLPVYMVPAAFVVLDAFPVSAHGKVDRRALPAPDGTRGEAGFVAPRTPVERKLAELWAQTLRVDKVGLHDNFFDLGGDSILSIQIVARANGAGLRLTPRHLFQHQTIAELAEVAAAAGADSAALEPAVPGPGGSPGDGGLPFPLAALDPGELGKVAAMLDELDRS